MCTSICRYLRQYKEAFTEENVMYTLGSVLADLCQKVSQMEFVCITTIPYLPHFIVFTPYISSPPPSPYLSLYTPPPLFFPLPSLPLLFRWDDRDDDDIVVIERILLLIRNLLDVTADPDEEKVSCACHVTLFL